MSPLKEGADEARMRSIATGFSAARIGIGAFILLAPKAASRVLGFPEAHDNATARLAGRLFGVREVVIGAYTAKLVQDNPCRPMLYLGNAAVDAGDLTVCGLTLLGRRGVGRAAFGSALLAAPFTGVWLWLRGSCQA